MKPLPFLLILLCSSAALRETSSSAEPLSLSTFEADVTPPIGSPLCFNQIKPAANVEVSLTARGVEKILLDVTKRLLEIEN